MYQLDPISRSRVGRAGYRKSTSQSVLGNRVRAADRPGTVQRNHAVCDRVGTKKLVACGLDVCDADPGARRRGVRTRMAAAPVLLRGVCTVAGARFYHVPRLYA